MRPLSEYRKKRDFHKTSEPPPRALKAKNKRLIFVVQEHHASHLHYDFRLEWDGVLKSWAVPKGPSLDPGQRRLAVQVEDHPIDYAKFTGTIPKGEYGAGEVYRWDYGTWKPEGDPSQGLRKGRLEFELAGGKLKGKFLLIRTRGVGAKPNWLLIKRHDEYAQEGAFADPVAKSRRPSRARKSRAEKAVDEEPAPIGFTAPELAFLVDEAPKGKDWVHEIKFDGYRLQAHIQNKKARLFTRKGLDWTAKYPGVADSLAQIKAKNAVMDGEVVWLDERGRSDFQKLQNAMREHNSRALVFYAFDLLSLDGKDLRSLPLIARKDRLQKLVRGLKKNNIRYSEHFRDTGDRLFHVACQEGLEGIVSKRVDRPYVSGRQRDWVKVKCKQRQEFVIGGFTDPEGSRHGFGSLLLGYFDEGRLHYAGRCGTGFDHRLLTDIGKKLRALESRKSSFEIEAPKGKGLHWVKPKLVAEVAFSEWTSDGILRAPVFQGLREDKAPTEIGRERTVPMAESMRAVSKPRKKSTASMPKISHPERVIYSKEKITKLQVANYYQSVAPQILPHLKDRPLALVRCTQNSSKPCFFSKHFAEKLPESIIPVPEKGRRPFVAIDSEEGLMTLAQYGTLEIHCWGSHRQTIEFPDQVVMDLDPDPSVEFEQVKETALELREMLENLKLKTFIKVTGGKGLHVQFPCLPLYSWEQIKEFSQTLVREMVSRRPDLYTANMAKRARKGKIFVDYLRNGRGSTAIAPYSLRARPISSVAMPISWDELKSLKASDQFTLEKALEYLKKRRRDPWSDYFKIKQKIGILTPVKD